MKSMSLTNSRKTSLIGIIALIMFLPLLSVGQVVVTSPTINITTGTYPSAYNALGNIVLTETANGDFAVGTNVTLVLAAPANFEFQAGVGTASYGNPANFTAATAAVTATTITITYTVTGTNKADVLTLSGIMVRSLANAAGAQVYSTVA